MRKLALVLLACAAALTAFAENSAPKRSLADGFGKFRIGAHFNSKTEKNRSGARFFPPNFASGKNFSHVAFPLTDPIADCRALRVYFDEKDRTVALTLDMGRLSKEEFQRRWKEIADRYNLAAREGVPDAFDEIDPASGKPTGFALHVSEEKKSYFTPEKTTTRATPVYGGDGKRFRVVSWNIETISTPERSASWTEYAVTLVDEKKFRDAYARAAEEEKRRKQGKPFRW